MPATAPLRCMKHAVFFRNLNLGRPGCPTRAQFEEAFAAAGAQCASSYRVNGTLAFSAKPGIPARTVLAGAATLLRDRCGLKEPGFLRSMKQLVELVRSNPFGDIDHSAVHECCVTFLHSPRSLVGCNLPEATHQGDVRLVALARSEVLSLSFKVGASPGSPNAWIERLLGQPTTTRSWNTVAGLVDKHA